MPRPLTPPLNGRNLAEYYVSGEAAKLSTLRDYAKPVDQQQARILMYDPIRRIVPEYFAAGRDQVVLDRISALLVSKRFANRDYDATWHRSNEAAIRNLSTISINGEFTDIISTRASISIGGLRVLSTADFYATYVPKARNAAARRVAVIVNPAGVKKTIEKRKQWLNIESEVAYRAADAVGGVNAILYLDLQRQDVTRHIGPKNQVMNEIEATCYRLVRDWRELHLENRSDEESA